ncbi:MAG TPA: hypothetical protein VEF71_06680 [Streptosporangiaceae bacterium]|nr:hypothetical protein [Streptosporangiaceae bacterium]
MIGKEFLGGPDSSEAVDHGHPHIRVKADGPDLADQFAAPQLELALERLLVRGSGYVFVSPQAVTGQDAGLRRSQVKSPAARAAVGERHREPRPGFGRFLRGEKFLAQIAAKRLPAVRAHRTA